METFKFNFKTTTWTGPIDEVDVIGDNRNVKSVYLKALKDEQARYYADSIYAQFKPVACIVYFSVHGWTGKWVARFFSKIEDFEKMKTIAYTDEPTGKYGKARKFFIV